ncbi:MAG TPA: hypothetical protein VGR87_14105 [Candidatus Limnocylindria bacterium]|jgi:hypothetical protein|nr:hypothetical protein [Candidatus Limnocylindria bacterium]
MSVTSGTIVEVEGEAASPPGHDRRGAVTLAFALCLAVGSALVGRDGPSATAPAAAPRPAPAFTTMLINSPADRPLNRVPFVAERPSAYLIWGRPPDLGVDRPILIWPEPGTR